MMVYAGHVPSHFVLEISRGIFKLILWRISLQVTCSVHTREINHVTTCCLCLFIIIYIYMYMLYVNICMYKYTYINIICRIPNPQKTGGVLHSPLFATMAPKKCFLQAPNHPNLHLVAGPRIRSPDGTWRDQEKRRYTPVDVT